MEGWEGWEGGGGTSVGIGFKPYTMYNVICAQDNYQLPLVIGGVGKVGRVRRVLRVWVGVGGVHLWEMGSNFHTDVFCAQYT